MPAIHPGMLFEIAPSLSESRRPLLFPMLGDQDRGITDSLGVTERGHYQYAIDRADVLRIHLDHLLNDFQTTSFRFADNIWDLHQKPALKQLIESFLKPLSNAPSALWTHPVVWSPRSIQRTFYRGDIKRPERAPQRHSWHVGQRAKIDFGGFDRNPVHIPPTLLWLDPAENVRPAQSHNGNRIVRLSSQIDLVDERGRTLSAHSRQQIGIANPNNEEHRRLLAQGHHPAPWKLIHRLVKDTALRFSAASRDRIVPQDACIVDEMGILDAQLLRLQRYRAIEFLGMPRVQIQSLSVAFHRQLGFVIYIAAKTEWLSDRPLLVGEKLLHFTETEIGVWIQDQLRGAC